VLASDDPLGSEESESESESEGEDDTAALLAELEKIKRERAEEQARKEAIRAAEDDRIRTDNILQVCQCLSLTLPSPAPSTKYNNNTSVPLAIPSPGTLPELCRLTSRSGKSLASS